MKVSSVVLAAAAAAVPGATAWGGFGHITIAYIASSFVKEPTATFFQTVLRNQTDDYLAGIATWADSIRYTKWGHFTGPFHYIDAKDDPPRSCGVVLERDCKAEGCVVTALHNYTSQLLADAGGRQTVPELSASEREQAAKFVVHFVSDLHQPLHAEDVAKGGNGLHVSFDGHPVNLHHVWDTSIPEKIAGGVRRAPYEEARRWADALVADIRNGKFQRAAEKDWLTGIDLDDVQGTALRWSQESNAYVCTHVLPEGPNAIVGQELGGDYYTKAISVVELQVARAGYRLAAWLDLIAAKAGSRGSLLGEL